MPTALNVKMGLRELLVATPGRAGFTVRAAFVCAVVAIVVETYQLPSMAVTVYVVFFVYHADRGSTLLASLVMPIVMAVALVFAFAVAATVIDQPFWRVLAMAIFSSVALFLGSASKIKPFAPIIAMIVGYFLDLIGGLQFGEIATRGILYAWLVAGIPAAIAIITALLFNPSPKKLLYRGIEARLAAAADVLRDIDANALRRCDALLLQGGAGLRKLLKLASLEGAVDMGASANLDRAIDASLAILTYVGALGREPGKGLPAPVRHELAGTLDEMNVILRGGGYPVNIDASFMLVGGASSARASELAVLLRSCAEGFAVASAPARSSSPKSAFMAADAFMNPVHVHYALKTTAAAMLCYLLFQQLDWSGIHTSLITCYVVSLGSAGETIEKLTLRLAGCLMGAALGFGALIFVLPHVQGIAALSAVVFVGAMPAAWVAGGGPRIGYAGLQIALAFFLIIIQGASPAFDLTIGRDRIIGVLLGNLVIYFFFARVWPVSVCGRVDGEIGRLLRSLAALATAGRLQVEHAIGSVEDLAGTIRQDLTVARYEPPAIRPSPEWLADREAFIDRARSFLPDLAIDAALRRPSAVLAGLRLREAAEEFERSPDREHLQKAGGMSQRPLAILDEVSALLSSRRRFHAAD